MYAAAAGKKDASVLLVSRQADWNIKDADGMTAYD
jgi:ankyrin repeat protein